MSRFISVICIAMVVAVAGCASTGSNPNAGRSPDLITEDEIATSGASNALEAVRRLRPNWMRARGISSIGRVSAPTPVIATYLDGQRLGDLSSLRLLSVAGIKSMQWLDAARASTLLSGLGSDAIGGAIVIKTH